LEKPDEKDVIIMSDATLIISATILKITENEIKLKKLLEVR
tara:strand:+ start:175 stop:297 length:123 start_codon:yes stop_codon:yes gene_type:complete